ncbi:host attachment protein [Thiomicrorhabdus sp.]|uniref:host attachment protein n=1 Tax=Thiomicrorhabdus sp. TaxID=2039724 RepID=UPI002AA8F9B2|nr:host attachment protein [Thiomicrorhabdus sp.]
MNTTIGYAILADLGNIKVFSIDQTEQKTVSLHAYQSIENAESHAKLSEIYSDKAGNFSNSVSSRQSSYESKEGMKQTQQLIENLSAFINEFAEQHNHKLYLSVSNPIHTQIKEKLSDSTLAKIKAFLAKDLTQQKIENIMKAFEL